MATFSDDYLAGIFDGEGCLSCTIRSRGNSFQWQAYASVHMGGCLPVLEAFMAKFGGSIVKMKKPRLNGHEMHMWHIQSNYEAMSAFCEWVIKRCWYKRRIARALLQAIGPDERVWLGKGKGSRTPFHVGIKRAEVFNVVSRMNSGKGGARSPHYDAYVRGLH